MNDTDSNSSRPRTRLIYQTRRAPAGRYGRSKELIARTRYWTADLHFGHTHIIRYCERPFADVEEMDRALVDRWNDVVDDGDEVWVLGDVALGRIDHTLALVGRLRGRRMLLAGNHDRCWAGHGAKAEPWVERYLDAGFDEVRQGTIETTLGNDTVLCCHFPYRGDSHDPIRFAEHRPIDRGGVLLHGHVHERWKVDHRQVNVGGDVWDFRPVSGQALLEALDAASDSGSTRD